MSNRFLQRALDNKAMFSTTFLFFAKYLKSNVFLYVKTLINFSNSPPSSDVFRTSENHQIASLSFLGKASNENTNLEFQARLREKMLLFAFSKNNLFQISQGFPNGGFGQIPSLNGSRRNNMLFHWHPMI